MPRNIHYVKSKTTAVFEGIPGVGKSTITTEAARELKRRLGDEYIIFLNFAPLEGDAVETVLATNTKGSKRGMDFIRMVYDPEIKAENLHFATTVTGQLIAKELKFNSEYVVDKSKGKKHLINIIERNSASAAGIFIAGNYYNMRLASDLPGDVRNRYDGDWKNVVHTQNNMAAAAKNVFLTADESERFIIVFLETDYKKAFERVVKRGRNWEADKMTIDYMRELDNLQRQYAGLVDEDKALHWKRLYPVEQVKTIHFDVDKYYTGKEETKERDIINMVEDCNEVLFRHLIVPERKSLWKRFMDFVLPK